MANLRPGRVDWSIQLRIVPRPGQRSKTPTPTSGGCPELCFAIFRLVEPRHDLSPCLTSLYWTWIGRLTNPHATQPITTVPASSTKPLLDTATLHVVAMVVNSASLAAPSATVDVICRISFRVPNSRTSLRSVCLSCNQSYNAWRASSSNTVSAAILFWLRSVNSLHFAICFWWFPRNCSGFLQRTLQPFDLWSRTIWQDFQSFLETDILPPSLHPESTELGVLVLKLPWLCKAA